MPRPDRERRRLITRTVRVLGLAFTGCSFILVAVSGAAAPERAIVPAILLVAVGVAFVLLGRARTWFRPVLTYGLGVAVLAASCLPATLPRDEIEAAGIQLFASTAMPSLLITLSGQRWRTLAIVGSFLPVIALTLLATAQAQPLALTALSVVIGWIAFSIVSHWLGASIDRAAAGIDRLKHAHAGERLASEREASRRRNARLLHDTVLATLTLLAHSGVGVNAGALRHQAAEDARLLRQLRLGGSPTPTVSGSYNLEPVETSDLGHTLESVKQRFGHLGLEVAWHGTGHVLLRSDVLDAFLLSLSECLENVRRHSGVGAADVTITEDDTTVRAMVTDEGVGFDLSSVDVERLGIAESVMARIRDVGGNVRLFSAPGSGTTVVLEVPR
ncbi:sensor histidine kinase [Cnuibacter sp. UC19_7]|uniref:sensor histidine kinase n=1 Tax=Cnuibacter sp. UC19_7 TaxID=3350166 RepID=UPI00366B705B